VSDDRQMGNETHALPITRRLPLGRSKITHTQLDNQHLKSNFCCLRSFILNTQSGSFEVRLFQADSAPDLSAGLVSFAVDEGEVPA
jgi:hypothetical protein